MSRNSAEAGIQAWRYRKASPHEDNVLERARQLLDKAAYRDVRELADSSRDDATRWAILELMARRLRSVG